MAVSRGCDYWWRGNCWLTCSAVVPAVEASHSIWDVVAKRDTREAANDMATTERASAESGSKGLNPVNKQSEKTRLLYVIRMHDIH